MKQPVGRPHSRKIAREHFNKGYNLAVREAWGLLLEEKENDPYEEDVFKSKMEREREKLDHALFGEGD